MRPQHITAENIESRHPLYKAICASMRPQHITAENVFVSYSKHKSTRLQ